MTIYLRFLCATLFGICNAVFAVPIEVLWYTYADPSSEYVSFYSSLAGSGPGSAASYVQSSGLVWEVTFFGPESPSVDFAGYDVLVIHSGEAFRTGAPGGPLATPNYAGILGNRAGIEAARGIRTFISGSDADFHAVRGDSGLCPSAHCGDFDGARGYVINAVNWAASGAGLGILSFFHGEFPGSFWWDDPNSFLRSELQGNWTDLSPSENTAIIADSAAGYAPNQGLTSAGLSDWVNSFHGGFSNIPGYASTVDSGSYPGFSVSIATIDLCQPSPGRYCLAATVGAPSSVYLVAGGILLLLLVCNSMHGRSGSPSPQPSPPLPGARGICFVRRSQHARGFTLLELLVVMVIIGLLASYVGPKYFGQIGKSEVKTAQAQIDAFGKALDHYRLDAGHYPTTEQGLNALVSRPPNEPKWTGPYLAKAVPMDPWGRPYQYKSPGEHGEYDLLSLGKDGQPGGTGEAADITSWQ